MCIRDRNGRITREDVQTYLDSGQTKEVDKIEEPLTEQVKTENITSGESIPRLRKKIAENMVESKKTSAHVMTTIEIDYETIARIRNKIKEAFKKEEGFSLTYLPFIANATVEALKEHPVVNSSFNLEEDQHVLHSNIDLG